MQSRDTHTKAKFLHVDFLHFTEGFGKKIAGRMSYPTGDLFERSGSFSIRTLHDSSWTIPSQADLNASGKVANVGPASVPAVKWRPQRAALLLK
jgi:hypothetical protein